MDLKAPAVLSIAWLIAVLNGCHTAQGFGKDIENLGLLIQRELNQSANAEVHDGGERYVGEEPYAQEMIDWSHPLENGASQDAPDDGPQAKSLSTTQ